MKYFLYAFFGVIALGALTARADTYLYEQDEPVVVTVEPLDAVRNPTDWIIESQDFEIEDYTPPRMLKDPTMAD